MTRRLFIYGYPQIASYTIRIYGAYAQTGSSQERREMLGLMIARTIVHATDLVQVKKRV
jgi:hypothetical protein